MIATTTAIVICLLFVVMDANKKARIVPDGGWEAEPNGRQRRLAMNAQVSLHTALLPKQPRLNLGLLVIRHT